MTGRNESTSWIVIPTYWGAREGSPFDHPTPLDGESTLPRLLESLRHQSEAPRFAVLVLLATVDANSAEQASQRVVELCEPYRHAYPLAVADYRALLAASSVLRTSDLDPSPLDLSSYSGIRNLQLLLPAALGAELIIALDDDEVVPPLHVARAHQSTNALSQRGRPFGIAGPYLDSSGSPFLPETAEPSHLFEEKSAFMNRTIRQLIEDDDPYPRTPLALGGNMVFPRSLFAQVGFDPGITRGEDIDYLINARMSEIDFHLDKVLAIEHLPPRQYEASAYGKLRQDVYRFIYQREKLRQAGFASEAFDPYPGRLLRGNLKQHAQSALEDEAAPDEVSRWGLPARIVAEAQDYAAEWAPKYFEFAARWPSLVEALTTPAASEIVRQSLLG